MLQQVRPLRSAIQWFSYSDVKRGTPLECLDQAQAACVQALFDWTRDFLMRPHKDLGRIGDVCPFTAQASRLDALRFAASDGASADLAGAIKVMRQAFEQFDAIVVPPRMANFRAVLVAFPQCDDPAGLAMLAATQKSLRLLSFRRGRMIGLFHERTQATGLWNPDFRPLRAPLPVLALRALVEQDAAFVLRHPLLAPTYLMQFRWGGLRRLAVEYRRLATNQRGV